MMYPRQSKITFVLFFMSSSFSLVISDVLGSPVARNLLPRVDDTCGGFANYTQCAGNFPSDFCCQSGTTCYAFDENRGVICCPSNDCSFISALSCEEQFYNATAFPTSPVHLVDPATPGSLCTGGTCCPQGYACVTGGCMLSPTTSTPSGPISTPFSVPATMADLVSSSTAPMMHTTVPASMTETPVPLPTVPAQQNASTTTTCPHTSPGAAVAAGLFPGLLAGSALTFAFLFWQRRRESSQPPRPPPKGSGSSFGSRRGPSSWPSQIPTHIHHLYRALLTRLSPQPREHSSLPTLVSDRSSTAAPATAAEEKVAEPPPSKMYGLFNKASLRNVAPLELGGTSPPPKRSELGASIAWRGWEMDANGNGNGNRTRM